MSNKDEDMKYKTLKIKEETFDLLWLYINTRGVEGDRLTVDAALHELLSTYGAAKLKEKRTIRDAK